MDQLPNTHCQFQYHTIQIFAILSPTLIIPYFYSFLGENITISHFDDNINGGGDQKWRVLTGTEPSRWLVGRLEIESWSSIGRNYCWKLEYRGIYAEVQFKTGTSEFLKSKNEEWGALSPPQLFLQKRILFFFFFNFGFAGKLCWGTWGMWRREDDWPEIFFFFFFLGWELTRAGKHLPAIPTPIYRLITSLQMGCEGGLILWLI